MQTGNYSSLAGTIIESHIHVALESELCVASFGPETRLVQELSQESQSQPLYRVITLRSNDLFCTAALCDLSPIYYPGRDSSLLTRPSFLLTRTSDSNIVSAGLEPHLQSTCSTRDTTRLPLIICACISKQTTSKMSTATDNNNDFNDNDDGDFWYFSTVSHVLS